MRIKATFADEKTHDVSAKVREPVLDRELMLSVGETLSVDLRVDDRAKLFYVKSSLEMDDGAYTSEMNLRTVGADTISMRLAPGYGYVIPVPATVDNVEFVSNSPSDGTIRIVVI